MEPHTDPSREHKHRLAREIIRFVEAARKRNAFGRLYLVAPPQALGDLRGELGASLGKMVGGELDKDLTHLAIHELDGSLRDLLEK